MKQTVTTLFAGLVLLTPSQATLFVHPYGMPAPHGVFAMATAGVHTGNGYSPSGVNNYAIVTGQTQTALGLTPQNAFASFATSAHNTAASSANASVGVARIASEFGNPDALPAVQAGAYADAGWFDTLTFSAAGLAGQPGQLTFLLGSQATLFGGLGYGNAGVSYMATTTAPAPELFVHEEGSALPAAGAYSAAIDTIHTVTFDFVWGSGMEFLIRTVDRVTMRTLFGGIPPGSIGTVEHLLFWGGIAGVTANGSPVDTYSLVSASGVDYHHNFDPDAGTVPEPGSIVLVAAGLGAVLGLRRRDS
ncbi:MAG: PEP-CTERM sorting domain-containing protein [Bryobacterales bacterium]|nr:PEP-CTERM sorting domain-containing protein [Bryobacterales bacterium]